METKDIPAADAEAKILDLVKLSSTVRDDIVPLYAQCIKNKKVLDWADINLAIIQCWSKNALVYIKRQAWKMVENERT